MVRVSEHKVLALLLATVLILTQFSLFTTKVRAEDLTDPGSIISENADADEDEDNDTETAGENGEDGEDGEETETEEETTQNGEEGGDENADEDAGENGDGDDADADNGAGTDAVLPEAEQPVAAAAAMAPFALGQSTVVTLVEGGTLTPGDIQNQVVTVKVYKGFLPYFYELSPAAQQGLMATSLTEVTAEADGTYVLGNGIYSYYVRGDGHYSVIKIFIIDDNSAVNENLLIETGPTEGALYGPNPERVAGQTYNSYRIPSTARIESQETVICLWPDEILDHFGDALSHALVADANFSSPYFTNPRPLHSFTTQEEMMEFLRDEASNNDNMYLFNLGKSPVYGFEIPLVLFTTSNIPSSASLSRAAEIVNNNGKATLWHQAQIHPNEPASGEAALIMVQEMNDSFGDGILDEINVVLIPRINVDGSVIYSRYTAEGFDMNRDHMALKAIELVYVHGAYIQFMPEMAVDGHEFPDFFGYLKPGTMNDADDVQIDPATSLNNSPALTSFGINAVQEVFDNADAAGDLRAAHYGTTVNNPIGRAYYGLYGSVSILVETRGIGAGSTAFPRRVYGQVLSMKTLYQYAADNADELKTITSEARADIIEKGKTYDTDDILVLKHSKSGSTTWPEGVAKIKYNLYGSAIDSIEYLALEDTIERSRPRPTAYIIPKGESWTEKALYILKNQGAEYYEVEPGSTIPVQQYYNVQDTYNASGTLVGCIADLHDEARVTFPNGAIVVPMDQVAGNIIAMIMEPDVGDSEGYDGTLVQNGINNKDTKNFPTYDDNGDYPIYRYIRDDARNNLNVSYASGGGGGSSSGGSSSSKSGSNKADTHGATTAATTTTTTTTLGTGTVTREAVSQASVVADVTKKLAESSQADVVVKNAATVSSDTLKAMLEAAQETSGTVRLLADTVEEGSVIARLYIEPAKSTLEGDIKLGAFTSSDKANKVSQLFDKFFENTVRVVELEQEGSYGMTIQVAVKVSLDDLNRDNLRFYTYDTSTNMYYALTTEYFVDTNGYVHFYTDMGGAILITDSALARK